MAKQRRSVPPPLTCLGHASVMISGVQGAGARSMSTPEPSRGLAERSIRTSPSNLRQTTVANSQTSRSTRVIVSFPDANYELFKSKRIKNKHLLHIIIILVDANYPLQYRKKNYLRSFNLFIELLNNTVLKKLYNSLLDSFSLILLPTTLLYV